MSKYIGVGEIATKYGISQSTVRSWAKKGLIPYIKIGTGHFRFDSEAIELAIQQYTKNMDKVPQSTEPADKDL